MIQYQPHDDAMDDVMVQDPNGEYVKFEDVDDIVRRFDQEIEDLNSINERLESQLEERQDRCDELEKAMKEIRAYADV